MRRIQCSASVESGTGNQVRQPLARKSWSIHNFSPVCASGGRDSFQVGQTAKARSGYRVQSLRNGRDRQYGTYLTDTRPRRVVTMAQVQDRYPQEVR
jgi:hypothetical protein